MWGGETVYSYLSSAEVYDPNSGTFAQVAAMGAGRGGHTATLLPNGKVLVAGGWNNEHEVRWLSSAELYDPMGESFAVTGPMAVARVDHTATLLRNGKVLVVGGSDLGSVHASADLYE